jgi:hypothetical protein
MIPTVEQVGEATRNGTHLLSDPEWRALGLAQSYGWEHVATYTRRIMGYAYALLFRRELTFLSEHGNRRRTQRAPFLPATPATPLLLNAAAGPPSSPPLLTPLGRDTLFHDLHMQSKRFEPEYKVHVPSGVVVSGRRVIIDGEPRQGPVALPASVVGPNRVTALSRALEPIAMETINEVVDQEIRWEGGRPFRAMQHADTRWIIGGWLVGPTDAPVVEEFIAYHSEHGIIAGDTTDLVASESKEAYDAFVTAFPYLPLPDLDDFDDLGRP